MPVRYARAKELVAEIIMHDPDTKLPARFDTTPENAGIDARQSACRAPNTMAFVERFIQSIQQECLDYFSNGGTERKKKPRSTLGERRGV